MRYFRPGGEGRVIAALVAFLLLYLSPFLLQNGAQYKIGNDFQIVYANYATYSVDAARAGFSPLWNPSEACGYPLLTNPFTAFFYPGRLLTFILAAGSPLYSWYHHQWYMVLGVCWLAVGTYVWLRSRGIERAAAVFAAGAIAIGFRVADIYRLPNAVHAAAWMPWILYAYDRWLERRVATGFLLGAFSLFCLATAGYPYYAVYAMPLLGSYILLRIAEGAGVLRASVAAASMTVPVAFLVLPYYSGMSRMLARTVDRSGGNYQYSTTHAWSYVDLLGGLFFPPSAMSEGWLYCGLVPLLIVLVWASVRRPLPKSLLWIAGLTFGVQLIAAGGDSFIFPAFWSFVPGMDTLRIWPRMTTILLFPLALLIGLAYDGLVSARIPDRLVQRAIWCIAIVVAALQILLWTTKSYASYTLLYFPRLLSPVSFVIATFVGAVFLTVWAFQRSRAHLGWAFVALLVTASDTGTYGLKLWREYIGVPIPSASLDLPGYYSHFFTIPRTAGFGMVIPYAPTSGVIENWHYKTYAGFVQRYSKQPGFSELTGSHGQKLFFSSTLHAPPAQFAQWWQNAQKTSAVATVYPNASYNGNVLRVSYATPEPAYLIFVDNIDPDWRAYVNGAPAKLEASFGTFKAVRVPAGKGTVVFAYTPLLPHKKVAVVGFLSAIGLVGADVWRRRR
jgi:hypothetical protein